MSGRDATVGAGRTRGNRRCAATCAVAQRAPPIIPALTPPAHGLSLRSLHWHEVNVATPSAVFSGVDFGSGRLFRTADLDEARLECGRVFNPHRLDIVGARQRLRAGMDHLRLGPVSLNRLYWGAAVAVDPARLGDYYLVSMPVRGRAGFELDGRRTEVSPRCAGVVSAAQRFRFDASADFEQLVVRIERGAVEAGWHALTGAPPARAIDFDCALPIDGPAWQSLQPVLMLLARRTAASPTVDAAHLDARLQDLLVATLLLHQRHCLSDGLLPTAPRHAPAHLRHAEDWMRDRLELPITLGDVARACGVSTRTLQAAFQSRHGLGPMQWLRAQRLQAVRDALCAPDGVRTSVAQTALRFGFTHLGEFSQAYRRRFGETARTTLRRHA